MCAYRPLNVHVDVMFVCSYPLTPTYKSWAANSHVKVTQYHRHQSRKYNQHACSSIMHVNVHLVQEVRM